MNSEPVNDELEQIYNDFDVFYNKLKEEILKDVVNHINGDCSRDSYITYQEARTHFKQLITSQTKKAVEKALNNMDGFIGECPGIWSTGRLYIRYEDIESAIKQERNKLEGK